MFFSCVLQAKNLLHFSIIIFPVVSYNSKIIMCDLIRRQMLPTRANAYLLLGSHTGESLPIMNSCIFFRYFSKFLMRSPR